MLNNMQDVIPSFIFPPLEVFFSGKGKNIGEAAFTAPETNGWFIAHFLP